MDAFLASPFIHNVLWGIAVTVLIAVIVETTIRLEGH
jgi:hypothetical protein